MYDTHTHTHTHTHTYLSTTHFILSPNYYYGWLLGNSKTVKIMSLPTLHTVVSLASTFTKPLNGRCSKLPSLVYFPIRFYGVFKNNIHFVLNESLMFRQKLSIATRWPIIGMNGAGLPCRGIVRQLGRNHVVLSRPVR